MRPHRDDPLLARFTDLQRQLKAALESSRGHRHSTAAGDHTENNWLKLFKKHLPSRYQADRAFVLDSRSNQSQQLDVVIYDRQYSLLLYNQERQIYIPAESVYAVLEVRQGLNARNLRDASQRIASVRSLHRTNEIIHHAGGVIPKPKPLPYILGGILCTEGDWRPALGQALHKNLRQLSPEGQVDLGCVAERGSFEARFGDSGVDLTTHGGETALVSFLLTLLRRLQRMATVPAIEFPAYERALETGGPP